MGDRPRTIEIKPITSKPNGRLMTLKSNLVPVVYCQLKTDQLDLQTLVLELEPRL